MDLLWQEKTHLEEELENVSAARNALEIIMKSPGMDISVNSYNYCWGKPGKTILIVCYSYSESKSPEINIIEDSKTNQKRGRFFPNA